MEKVREHDEVVLSIRKSYDESVLYSYFSQKSRKKDRLPGRVDLLSHC